MRVPIWLLCIYSLVVCLQLSSELALKAHNMQTHLLICSPPAFPLTTPPPSAALHTAPAKPTFLRQCLLLSEALSESRDSRPLDSPTPSP